MTIEQKRDGNSLCIMLTGRLDTMTAPELDELLRTELDGVEHLTLDIEGLEYLSSAGLRVLLYAQNQMDAKGDMKVLHANEAIMEIFDITGFSEILSVERAQ